MTLMYGQGGGSGDPITMPPDDYRLGGQKVLKIMLGTGETAVEMWRAPLLQPHFNRNDTSIAIDQSVWTTLETVTVVGYGFGYVDAGWRYGLVAVNGNSHLRAMRVMLNGTQIGYWDHGGTKVMATSWEVESAGPQLASLKEGDVLTLQGYATSGAAGLRTITYRWLEIEPQ